MPETNTTEDLAAEMDRLSLHQALLDAEVANARAADLVQRLVEATGQITSLQAELAAETQAHAELRARHEAMRASQAYRMAERVWSVRNALQRR